MSPIPGIVKPAQTLKPKIQGIESRAISVLLIMHDFERLQPKWSMPHAIIVSNTAIIVDNAANAINKKNKLPHSCPRGICENTVGRVINTRPGPESGVIP